MQRVKPIGLNLRKTDYEIEDGFLQECINLQWRDNALRPIPNRIETNIDITGKYKPIMHKIGDEDVVNVLAFSAITGNLQWLGTITDGVYTQKVSPTVISSVNYSDGMSFVIQNGLIYFMGDGSSANERYYLQVKYLESTDTYEVKNLYSWKDNIVKFSTGNGELLYNRLSSGTDWDITFTNGVILVRYALVLDTGDVVMHSAIYAHAIKGFFHVANTGSPGTITTLKNIHTCISVSPDFTIGNLSSNVAAVNVYVTVPYYESEYNEDLYDGNEYVKKMYDVYLKNSIKDQIDTPFYQVSSIPVKKLSSDVRIYLYADKDDSMNIVGFTGYGVVTDYHFEFGSIAAGEVMPVDNFSRHKLYGKLTTYNGRLIIEQPTTILSQNLWDYNSLYDSSTNAGAKTAFNADTEDGLIKSELYSEGKMPISIVGDDVVTMKSIICYPDYRATRILFNGYDINLSAVRPTGSTLYALDLIRQTNQNIAYNLADIQSTRDGDIKSLISTVGPYYYFKTSLRYHLDLEYYHTETESRSTGSIPGYTSNNRIQFSAAGEFSTWPVLNSYRVGEGVIMSVGSNSIIPSETFNIAPLIIGTSDGVYSLNLDPSGNNLVASITRIANLPYISRNTLQIGSAIIFVSDKGLISIENNSISNLTEKFFPDHGGGNYPVQESVYPNYNVLSADFFGSGGNEIEVMDIVQYMKSAIFAFDSRRDNLWCCNPDAGYSLVYNIIDGLWTMSSLIIEGVVELYGMYLNDPDEIYSRHLLILDSSRKLYLLSGEDNESMVKYHLLTRPIKLQSPDDFKKINRFYSRCEIFDNTANDAYFTLGLWGKQDTNKLKASIALAAIKGVGGTNAMPYGVRQDIPVGRLSGKYKTITVLQGGNSTPESSINAFDFNASMVVNNINK